MGLGVGLGVAGCSIGVAVSAEDKPGVTSDGELGGDGGVALAALGAGLGVGCGGGALRGLGISGPATFSMNVENFLRNFLFRFVT